MRSLLLLVGLVALTACNGGPTGDDDDDTGTATPIPTGWQPLITGQWTLAGHSEDTSDFHIGTAPREMYIGGIRPIAPDGTHHTVLYKGSISNANRIYASGVGTGEILFPPGVGLKLLAGEAIGLQLHIFNVGDDPLSGTSGIEILEIAPEDVTSEADMFLPGPTNLNLPPSQSTTQSGVCNINQPQSIFALIPHMHQLGTHFKATANVSGQDNVLIDAPYDFTHQTVTAFTPIALTPGDTITTECTWNNTTTSSVGWGESSNEEMCFTILYRYPAQGSDFCE